MRTPVDHVWVIIYVETDNLKYLKRDMQKSINFRKLTPYIPTVKVLTKNFKGKPEYKEVPFLLNYGFIRMPLKDASSQEFLKYIKSHISSVLGFVRGQDYSTVIDTNSLEHKLPIAIASDDEVTKVYTSSLNASIYSSDDLESLKPGSCITLHGYPFEGVLAEVIKINHSKKEVKVSVDIYKSKREVTVSFENVFYTVYNQTIETPMRERSLEEIQEITQSSIDSILMKNNYFTE